MGCVESRLESDLQTNIFHVVNVNERGQRQRSSRLEVTESHLVLHQRGRGPIRWPLRCLRRYGFDAEQFSFESGRRCPTGPGIYTFKCRRAEALFNMLQYQIQNIAEDAASRDLSFMPSNPEARELIRTDSRTNATLDSQGYLEPLARTRRGLNSISGTSISSPQIVASSGANGGVGGLGSFSISGGMRSPNSPGPRSPAAVSFFGNTGDISSNRLDDVDDPRSPATPAIDPTLPRDPPTTPLDSVRNVFMNYLDRTVSYINNNERPSSYSSSGSERPVSYINHIDRPISYTIQSERPLSYVKIDASNAVDDLMRCRQRLYMNVDTTDPRRDRDHVYANLGLDKDTPILPPRTSGGSGSSHSGTTTITDPEQPINYIQVDLDRGSDSSQAAPLSPIEFVSSIVPDCTRAHSSSGAPPVLSSTTTRGYATIDFDKTEALSSTAKAAAMWKSTGADGSRRSRHNSTFSIGRHNSTLSD